MANYRILTARDTVPDVGNNQTEFTTYGEAEEFVPYLSRFRSLFASDLPLKIVPVEQKSMASFYAEQSARAKQGFNYNDGWGTE